MTTEPAAADFSGQTLHQARFTGTTLIQANAADALVRFSNLQGLTIRECDVDRLEIDSHDLFFGSLVVNGVDVVPLVKAELNRQYPGRELMETNDPEGLREGFQAVKAAWAATVEQTPAELREATVRGEWSLSQTLRHLVLVTDAWLRSGIQQEPEPFQPIGQVFDGAQEMGFDMTRMRPAKDFDEILAVRAERQRMVEDFLDTVTQSQLDQAARNPWDPQGKWRPSVGDCIRVVLEEWAHLRCIRRDLAAQHPGPGDWCAAGACGPSRAVVPGAGGSGPMGCCWM
ncbi:DinB family protein [Luteococcus peritonei]|uniref:DinB family protein n=1 Tax=Luteococcus peritonei TaxID=88874 RepID=A0ABW4RX92_9ACTN